jgi:hypothetical protein
MLDKRFGTGCRGEINGSVRAARALAQFLDNTDAWQIGATSFVTPAGILTFHVEFEPFEASEQPGPTGKL